MLDDPTESEPRPPLKVTDDDREVWRDALEPVPPPRPTLERVRRFFIEFDRGTDREMLQWTRIIAVSGLISLVLIAIPLFSRSPDATTIPVVASNGGTAPLGVNQPAAPAPSAAGQFTVVPGVLARPAVGPGPLGVEPTGGAPTGASPADKPSILTDDKGNVLTDDKGNVLTTESQTPPDTSNALMIDKDHALMIDKDHVLLIK